MPDGEHMVTGLLDDTAPVWSLGDGNPRAATIAAPVCLLLCLDTFNLWTKTLVFTIHVCTVSAQPLPLPPYARVSFPVLPAMGEDCAVGVYLTTRVLL